MTDEEKKALEEAKKAAQETIEKLATGKATEVANKAIEEATKSINQKVEELFTKFESASSKEDVTKFSNEFKKEISELQARIKAFSQVGGVEKKASFNECLAETIKENADAIRMQTSGGDQLDRKFTMKAVGDMSIAANFPSATPFIQQVIPGLVWNPYNRIWLADILPTVTTEKNNIVYPKEGAQQGGVAFWNKTGKKAQVDYSFTSESAYVKWLAGFVVIEREMLDDIEWLTSYLQQKLLIGLKTAENDFVLNGTTDTPNPAKGLLKNATAYDGSFTNFGEMVIDAAYGQIPTATQDFYTPTNVILHPRDTVAIGLNKAEGSGEYDLPPGSVTFGAGRLNLAGLDTIPTTSITRNSFIAFDRNAIMFIRRMNPEIQMFVDSELAKENKVMFRIEERVAQAIFNENAIVKGTYTP